MNKRGTRLKMFFRVPFRSTIDSEWNNNRKEG